MQTLKKPTHLFRPLLASVLFFIVFSSLALILSYLNFDDQRKTYLDSVQKVQSDKIDRARLTLSELSLFSYESIIFNNDIIEIIAQANTSDLAVQSKARNSLYKKLYKDYQWLKSHNVRQLHFHLPNSISFLRFHRPNKFGDSLAGIRHSIDLVNKTLQPVTGFEEGRIFNGFRHVYPLFYKGQFVGSVEISYGIDGIGKVLALNKNSNDIFILSKPHITSKLFESERSNYSESEFSPDWVVDSTAIESGQKFGALPIETISQINQKIKTAFVEKISKRTSCSGCTLDVFIGRDGYTVSFIPIYNVSEEKVGFIISYAKDDFIPIMQSNALKFKLISLAIIVLLSIGLYVFLNVRLKALRAIEYEAVHDDLTGLYNRKELSDDLPILLKQAHKKGQSLGVIFFDIDHFKNFNDNYGHDLGDEVLISFSNLVQKNIRETDLFVRWGGEEFLLISPDSDSKSIQAMAEKIKVSIENHKFTHLNLTVTSSFGVTLSLTTDDEVSLINRTDKLLYKAKTNGRNRVEFSETDEN